VTIIIIEVGGVVEMPKDKISMLEWERERLLKQWTRNDGDRVKLLVRIMEIEEQIDELKKGA